MWMVIMLTAALSAMVRKELGSAKQPLHYLAIPPSLFGTVAAGIGKIGMRATMREW